MKKYALVLLCLLSFTTHGTEKSAKASGKTSQTQKDTKGKGDDSRLKGGLLLGGITTGLVALGTIFNSSKKISGNEAVFTRDKLLVCDDEKISIYNTKTWQKEKEEEIEDIRSSGKILAHAPCSEGNHSHDLVAIACKEKIKIAQMDSPIQYQTIDIPEEEEIVYMKFSCEQTYFGAVFRNGNAYLWKKKEKGEKWDFYADVKSTLKYHNHERIHTSNLKIKKIVFDNTDIALRKGYMAILAERENEQYVLIRDLENLKKVFPFYKIEKGTIDDFILMNDRELIPDDDEKIKIVTIESEEEARHLVFISADEEEARVFKREEGEYVQVTGTKDAVFALQKDKRRNLIKRFKEKGQEKLGLSRKKVPNDVNSFTIFEEGGSKLIAYRNKDKDAKNRITLEKW